MEALGEDIDHPLWSAKCLVCKPEAIQQAHTDYYAAGADVAITASYQASVSGFKELGLNEEEALAAMRTSVELARKAAPAGCLVAGSVGSYGASLHNGAEYTGDFGDMDEAKLIEWHRPRITALIEAKCDVLSCETVPSALEAKALAKLIDEVKHPAWIAFSCKSGTESCSGEPFLECVKAAASSAYVVGVGVNCTHPSFVKDLVKTCREYLPKDRHVVVYPNSGEVWCGETHTWKTGTATADAAFVDMAKEWIASGADCVGGCCRTSPATIKCLRGAFPAAATA